VEEFVVNVWEKKLTVGKYEMKLNREHFYFCGFFRNLETGKLDNLNNLTK